MSSLTARVVNADGSAGPILSTGSFEGAGFVEHGATIITDQLAAMTRRGQRTQREAFDLLDAEGWSNGYVQIGGTG